MEDFIETMLRESEAQEKQLQLSQIDAILIEISSLQSNIEKSFQQAEEEKKIIDDWAIQKTSKLQEKIEWLSGKLEAFMNEQDIKTRSIDLPHGQLLRRKTIDKLEIDNLELFLTNKNLHELSTLHPEEIVPDKNKIKNFYRMTRKIPAGVTLIEGGKDKFSIKLKQNGGSNGKTEDGIGTE